MTAARVREAVLIGTVLALGVGAVLQIVHAGVAEPGEPPPLLHWLRDSVPAIPLAGLVAVGGRVFAASLLRWAGLRTGGAVERGAAVLAGAYGFALASAPGNALHGALFAPGAHKHHGGFLEHAVRDGAVVLLASCAVLALIALASTRLVSSTQHGGLR